MTVSRSDSPSRLAVAGALLAVYVFWGSTAAAMRIAVATVPPLELAGLRYVAGGIALWAYARSRGTALPSRREWFGAAITGLILLVFGNATFAWVLQYIPSSIGSLFFSLSPLWMAMLGAAMYGEKLSKRAIAGIAVGLAGMVYLTGPSAGLPPVAALVAVFSSIAWAFGSMLQRRFPIADAAQGSAMQMLAGGALSLVFAPLVGERIAAASFTPAAIGSLVYLAVFGSIVGFSCFIWLLRNVNTTLASTYAYVNPIVAIAIGTTLLHEHLTPRTFVAAGIVLVGVALMIASPSARRAPAPTARAAAT